MDFMTFTLNTPMFDFLVLSIIAEGDAYGYQISQIIKRVSDTKDSALYPILKKLQENGYARDLLTSSFRDGTANIIRLHKAERSGRNT